MPLNQTFYDKMLEFNVDIEIRRGWEESEWTAIIRYNAGDTGGLSKTITHKYHTMLMTEVVRFVLGIRPLYFCWSCRQDKPSTNTCPTCNDTYCDGCFAKHMERYPIV